MSVDPIRARLDDMAYNAACPVGYTMADALRAILDLCDTEDRIGWGITETDDIRRVIAEHLGVTDV